MQTLIQGIEEDGLTPGTGYFLGDLRMMKAMPYERKMTLTRQAYRRVDLDPAMEVRRMNMHYTELEFTEGIYMPDLMIDKLTEHGSMGGPSSHVDSSSGSAGRG